MSTPNPLPIDDVLEMSGLSGLRSRRSDLLSGGQQHRVDLALAVFGIPELIFLDEPTTGFDPGARRQRPVIDKLLYIRPIALTLIFLVSLTSNLACDSVSDTAPPLPTYTPVPTGTPLAISTPVVPTVPITTPPNEPILGTSAGIAIIKPATTRPSSSKPHDEPSTSTPSEAFELGLPFTAEHQPLGMMPLGETINHDPPHGHPGIDFQWPYEAEIIVAVDGIVGDIQEDVNPFDGAITYNLTIVSGKHGVIYGVTDLYVFNPDLKIDDYVETGRVLGYSQRASKDDMWTIIHWAVGIVMESNGRPNPEGVIERYFFGWLCPMPYLLASERDRLLLVWNESDYKHKDKFPEICNGYYKD